MAKSEMIRRLGGLAVVEAAKGEIIITIPDNPFIPKRLDNTK